MEYNSFKIRWELLSDDELDFLNSVGLIRHDSGVEFSRKLSWEDYCQVLAYLLGLDRRTIQEGNLIAGAIGDCINNGEELFGKDKIGDWLHEFMILRNKRDLILNMVGGTVIYLQQVEYEVKSVCALAKLDGLNIMVEDVLSRNPKRMKKTLGQIAKVIKKTDIFNFEFEQRLTDFVGKRNDFIHNLWIDTIFEGTDQSGLPSEKEYERIYNFLKTIIKDARYVQNVFRGLYIQLKPTRDTESNHDVMNDEPLGSWVRYLPLLHSALRKTTNKNREIKFKGDNDF
ncbi:MAG: hypothetical protein PVF83_11530 [Anaerolineales bacterium]|jgi:hypothetical protein